MGFKLNIRNNLNNAWINLLTTEHILMVDLDGYFTSTSVDGALSELYEKKPNVNRTSTSPTSNSDSDAGYRNGDIWVNELTDSVYICVDNTNDNAIWKKYSDITNIAKIYEETATEEQTEFTANFNWNDGDADIYIDGVYQYKNSSYTDTPSAGSVIFSEGLSAGNKVLIKLPSGSTKDSTVKKYESLATEGQTIINLSFTYQPGKLLVYINGVYQMSDAFSETDSDTITMSESLNLNDKIAVITT